MGVQSLAFAIKAAVDRRIERESRAMYGSIQNGLFQCGAKSLPFETAVDCDTSDGNKVWALTDQNGNAVIVGD